MKPCHYCGHHNDDAALRCAECDTALSILESAPGSKRRNLLGTPGNWVGLLALLVIVQAFIRLELTPYDPSLGEGDYQRVAAVFYLWLSLGIGGVLFGYGLYLIKKRTGLLARRR